MRRSHDGSLIEDYLIERQGPLYSVVWRKQSQFAHSTSVSGTEPDLPREDVDDIVAQLLNTRIAILRDSTPMNFCAWPAAFTTDGRVRGATGGLSRMSLDRSACSSTTDRQRPPSTRIRSVRTRADSTVVETETDFGGLQYWDEYRCARDGRFMMCRFSLLGWVEK
jgi:hypothetical protein